MPLPILGVDSDGMIVMCNTKAIGITEDNICFEVGRNISEYIPENVRPMFENIINNGCSETIESYSIMGKNYKILIEPLLGHFKGKGVTLLLV